MKIWVDDIREAPVGYIWCKSVNQTIKIIKDTKQIEIIDDKPQETGLYTFVKIKKSISNNIGLKEGYILITYDEIN